jgi:hypothetical protein
MTNTAPTATVSMSLADYDDVLTKQRALGAQCALIELKECLTSLDKVNGSLEDAIARQNFAAIEVLTAIKALHLISVNEPSIRRRGPGRPKVTQISVGEKVQ